MMETKMTMIQDVMDTVARTACDERELNRDLPVMDRMRDNTASWALAGEIRGSLNALLLCVRVLEENPSDSEAREYARHITAATQRLERLLARKQTMQSM